MYGREAYGEKMIAVVLSCPGKVAAMIYGSDYSKKVFSKTKAEQKRFDLFKKRKNRFFVDPKKLASIFIKETDYKILKEFGDHVQGTFCFKRVKHSV